MPDDIEFNKEAEMGIMSIDGPPALHIICGGARFNAACFLSNVSSQEIWGRFQTEWMCKFGGAPYFAKSEQGSQFASAESRRLLTAHGAQTKPASTESHSFIGLAERCHSPPRRIYVKLKMTDPTRRPSMLLATAVCIMMKRWAQRN